MAQTVSTGANAMNSHDVSTRAKAQLRIATDPVEKLRHALLIRGASGIKEFARSFRISDDNDNRMLELSELKKAIHDFKVPLKDSETTELFNMLDKDGSKAIDFNEFLFALRPPMSKARVAVIDLAFAKLDKSGDGVVTVDDMRGVYNAKKHPQYLSGEKSEDEIYKMFLKQFDVGGHEDGKITREEFENYYAGVSSSIDSDIYFDLMMRNAWKF